MRIYKHKISGELLLLTKQRTSNINTFVVINRNYQPIKESFGILFTEVKRIILGFDKLEFIAETND